VSKKEQRLSRDLQKEFDLTPVQAAGLVGNLSHESKGLNSSQKESNKGKKLTSREDGIGWAQWSNVRHGNFIRFAKKNGLNINTDKANRAFLFHELNGPEKRTIAALKKTKTIDEASRVATNLYLRPDQSINPKTKKARHNPDERLKISNKILKESSKKQKETKPKDDGSISIEDEKKRTEAI